MHQPIWPPAALLAFLHARLDEVERVARAANVKQDDPEWWCSPALAARPGTVTVRSRRDNRPMARVESCSADEEADITDGDAVAEHIALHDPARELREVEAKRLRLRFIELCDDLDCADYLARIEALAFADHSGYREEWRPWEWRP